MMTSPVTSRRIFNNFRAETDRALPGRFGPTRCGPVYIRSLTILLLTGRKSYQKGKIEVVTLLKVIISKECHHSMDCI